MSDGRRFWLAFLLSTLGGVMIAGLTIDPAQAMQHLGGWLGVLRGAPNTQMMAGDSSCIPVEEVRRIVEAMQGSAATQYLHELSPSMADRLPISPVISWAIIVFSVAVLAAGMSLLFRRKLTKAN